MDDSSQATGAAARPSPPVDPARRQRLVIALFLIAAAVVALDQATKAWALAALTENRRVDLLGPLLGLRLTQNAGAAFSLATGATFVFTGIAVVVVAVIIRLSGRIGSAWWAAVLGLLLGGACGNLADRLFRPPGVGRGHVTDFLELPHWPVFNVADSSICCAAVLIAWLGFRGIGIDGSRNS